jgi:hypothetical protein
MVLRRVKEVWNEVHVLRNIRNIRNNVGVVVVTLLLLGRAGLESQGGIGSDVMHSFGSFWPDKDKQRNSPITKRARA